MGDRCLCGIPMSHEIPDRFEDPPVIFCSSGGQDGGSSWHCHVCQAECDGDKNLQHRQDCAYRRWIVREAKEAHERLTEAEDRAE